MPNVYCLPDTFTMYSVYLKNQKCESEHLQNLFNRSGFDRIIIEHKLPPSL